ncbi:hypothetical protein GCM10009682_54110 [Luedemannella flava]|uniref:Uncharacterized protein n=1 Tax=Luedemannella flava TaxID=349316 RepID=A0ABN2MIF3_9ACTN
MASDKAGRQRAWLRAVWGQASWRMRRLALTMWLGALAMTALGVVGDLLRWWEHLQFVMNLVSSLAGALFGLPVALIYLQRANAVEARHRRRQDLVLLARRAVEDMVDHVSAITYDPDKLDELTEVIDRLTPQAFAGADGFDNGSTLDQLLVDWQQVRRLIPQIFVDDVAGHAAISRAESEWTGLRDGLGPELREHGLHWTTTPQAQTLDGLRSLSLDGLVVGDELIEAIERAVRLRSFWDYDANAAEVELPLAGMEEYVRDVAQVVRSVDEVHTAALQLQAVIREEHTRSRT